MGKTAVNHYLSQFIIRNFAPNHEQIYELDLKTGTIKPRSTLNLFSGRRLWSQEIEDKITQNIENDLARIIKQVRNMPLAERKELFQATEITSKSDCDILARLILQAGLFQSKSDQEEIKGFENFLDNSKLMKSHSQVFYVKIRKELANITPLVLIDNALYICPVYVNDPKALAHFAFSYPISPYEFILFLSFQDVLLFLEQHRYSVHEINMRSIIQQNKECRIASTNKKYLELLNELINSYKIDNSKCQVMATRNPVKRGGK